MNFVHIFYFVYDLYITIYFTNCVTNNINLAVINSTQLQEMDKIEMARN